MSDSTDPSGETTPSGMTGTALASTVASIAARIGIPSDDTDRMLALATELDARPRLRAAFDRRRDWLAARLDSEPHDDRPEDELPRQASDDVALLAIVAAVPAAERWHEAHGIDPQVTAMTIGDIAVKLSRYGLGATGAGWFAQLVSGRVFSLGRLQFEPGQLSPTTGEPALGVHVPELGPLDPHDCDLSFARAGPFFAGVFGPPEPRAFVCSSWLLDPQLAEYLPAESNILRFQRRFAPVSVPEASDPEAPDAGDRAMAKFVFGRPLEQLGDVTPHTRLERAIVSHWEAGRHWREETGLLNVV
jgi:hypothetical protein